MERKARMKQETNGRNRQCLVFPATLPFNPTSQNARAFALGAELNYLAYFILCIQDIQNAGSRC
jgi:hypothetical protein